MEINCYLCSVIKNKEQLKLKHYEDYHKKYRNR